MKDGSEVTIRPIRAEDEPLMANFHQILSDRTLTMRYLAPILLGDRVTHERLSRITHNDYDREIALVVEGEENGSRSIFGVARLSKLRGADEEGRFTMLISDTYQGKGLGGELLRRIIGIGRDEKIKRIIALMSPDNHVMRHLFRSVGFSSFESDDETGMVKAQIVL